MNCRILVTDTAKLDLRDIAVYIADLSKDKNQAIRFVKELQEKTKILEQFPENGATPRDRVLKSNGYRFLVHKDYLIFYLYEKSENTAHIMAVGGRKHDYLCIMKKFL
jgi:plasmid stabilization system protein ParE